MSTYIMKATRDMGLSSTEKLILILIIEHLNVHADLSNQKIANILKLKESTVSAAVNHFIFLDLLAYKNIKTNNNEKIRSIGIGHNI